jgi:hypothetical protein
MMALLLLSYWALLARGGQTLSFYIIPVIPLTAINVTLAFNAMLTGAVKVVRFDVVRAVLLVIAVVLVVPYDINEIGFRFSQHPTSAQEQAITWIRQNVPHDAFLVVNSYAYLDLRLPGGQGVGDGAPYPHAEIYWNVAGDPAIYSSILDNNPDRIDYIVADSEMLGDLQSFGKDNIINKDMGKIVNPSYDPSHVVLVAQFSAPDHNSSIVIYIYQVVHQNAQPTAMSNQSSSPGALATTTHKPRAPVS